MKRRVEQQQQQRVELRCKHLAAGRERKSFWRWQKLSTEIKGSLLNGRIYLHTIYTTSMQRMHTTQHWKNHLTTKWAEDLNVFPKTYRRPCVKRHVKRCSTSLITREIKTAIKYHFIPVRMVITQKKNKLWWRCGEKGSLMHCWWECKRCSCCGNSTAVPQKLKVELPDDPATWYLPKQNKI